MKHLVIILMAATLISACQREPASGNEANNSQESDRKEATPDIVLPVDTAADSVAGQSIAIATAINHPDRPETDRSRDALRQPEKVLAFAGIAPDMVVLDVFTAGGYYAEILSRIVGDGGEVWAQNPPQFYDRFGSADLDFRLADRRLDNVERQDRPLEDLALPDERFDAIVAALVFHDFFWLTEDVPAILDQLNRSLKPGGVMLVTDHSAPLGTGSSMAISADGKHRVDEQLVTQLMQSAGFEFVGESELLRVPGDDRSLAFFEDGIRGQPTDRFVHLYRKPESSTQ